MYILIFFIFLNLFLAFYIQNVWVHTSPVSPSFTADMPNAYTHMLLTDIMKG